MDFLTQQFIAAAKRIRGELRDIGEKLAILHDDIEQQTDTIRTNYERSEQQQNTQPPIQISAELHTPEDVQLDRQTRIAIIAFKSGLPSGLGWPSVLPPLMPE